MVASEENVILIIQDSCQRKNAILMNQDGRSNPGFRRILEKNVILVVGINSGIIQLKDIFIHTHFLPFTSFWLGLGLWTSAVPSAVKDL